MSQQADDDAIRTQDVRVDYGDVTAVTGLNLRIRHGEVFGLIGPNGAGKTSTIKVLATLLEPTYGEVFIDGVDVAEHPRRVHRILGYMPDNPPVYADLKVWEVLDLFAGAYFVSRPQRLKRINECIDQVDLRGKRNALAGTLSTGMRQRLILAKTLLHDPKILLLDEPASGLDPIARVDLRNLLVRLSAEGKTVLISSHILSELSGFCTSVGIMQRGRLARCGRIDEIAHALRPHRRVVVELLTTDERWTAEARALSAVRDVRAANGRLDIDIEGDDTVVTELLARLVRAGAPVRAYYEQKMTMEDIMLQLGAREVS